MLVSLVCSLYVCVCVSFCSDDASTKEGSPKQQLLFVLLSTLQLFRCCSGERAPLGASLTAGNRSSVYSLCSFCHAFTLPLRSCRCVSCGSISLLSRFVKRLWAFWASPSRRLPYRISYFLTVSAIKYRCLRPPKKGPKNSYEETMLWEGIDPGGGHVSVTNNRSSNRQERPMFKNQVIVSLATLVFSHTAVLLSRLYYEFLQNYKNSLCDSCLDRLRLVKKQKIAYDYFMIGTL